MLRVLVNNSFGKGILMSIHNIIFHGVMRKILDAQNEKLALQPYIAPDKRGYPHNISFILPQKYVLWVPIRSASPRRF